MDQHQNPITHLNGKKMSSLSSNFLFSPAFRWPISFISLTRIRHRHLRRNPHCSRWNETSMKCQHRSIANWSSPLLPSIHPSLPSFIHSYIHSSLPSATFSTSIVLSKCHSKCCRRWMQNKKGPIPFIVVYNFNFHVKYSSSILKLDISPDQNQIKQTILNKTPKWRQQEQEQEQ